MEIADHLRRAGPWTALLVALPVLGAGASLAMELRQPTQWTSSATVLAAPSITDRSGAQYVNDFQSALTSDAVLQQVGEEAGVPVIDLIGALTSGSRTAGSSVLQVSFTSADRADAAAVPPIAARATFEALIDPLADAQRSQAAIVTQQHDAALAARDAYTNEIGSKLPAQAYQSALSELATLRNNYELARVEGRTTAGGLQARIGERQAEIAALAPQVVRFNLLQDDVDSTYAELSRLNFSLAATQAQLDSIGSGSSIRPGTARADNDRSRFVQPVLTAAIVGLGVAVLLLLAVLFLFDRRAPARAARPDSGAHARASDLAAAGSPIGSNLADGHQSGRELTGSER